MNFEDHCEESERLFGNRFEEVHKWLDEFAGTPEYGMRHRKMRHHHDGINQVIKLFGEEAGKAAKQHILSDLKLEGWSETDPFPKDREYYVKIGLF